MKLVRGGSEWRYRCFLLASGRASRQPRADSKGMTNQPPIPGLKGSHPVCDRLFRFTAGGPDLPAVIKAAGSV